MKFIVKNFFNKCDQIRRKLRVWSYLLKKSLMENFIFCAARNVLTIKNIVFQFSVRIPSVDMNKSAENCRFVHIY